MIKNAAAIFGGIGLNRWKVRSVTSCTDQPIMRLAVDGAQYVVSYRNSANKGRYRIGSLLVSEVDPRSAADAPVGLLDLAGS